LILNFQKYHYDLTAELTKAMGNQNITTIIKLEKKALTNNPTLWCYIGMQC